MNHSTPALPFAQTWWIEPGKIIGGRYPGTQDPAESRQMLAKLLDAGVRHVVNLQERDERGRSGSTFRDYTSDLNELAKERGITVQVHAYPIRDWGAPSVEQMREIQRTLRQATEAGEIVYVHCWGGHGRTGTVAGCWMAEQGMPLEQILRTIQQRRAHDPKLVREDSPQSNPQREMVRTWTSNQAS